MHIFGCSENHEDIQAIVDLALTQYGRTDSVDNHTGYPPKGGLLSIEDEQWRLGAEMIIFSVVRISRLVTPIMESQGGSAFLNITTFASFEPSQSLAFSGPGLEFLRHCLPIVTQRKAYE